MPYPTAFAFEYHSPSQVLEGLVAFHYVLRAGSAPFDETLCALLGQVQLSFGGSATYHLPRGPVIAPRLGVIAPTDQAIRMSAPLGFIAIGSALTPVGWTMLGEGGGSGNRISTLRSLELQHALEEPPKAAVSALDRWLTTRLSSAQEDPRVHLIDDWIVGGGSADVTALSEQLGLSRRSVERLTRRTHGSTPKRLRAKYRALKVAAAIAVGEVADWRLAPAAEGFADQSHFIREFRRYVGVTPGAFMAEPAGFARRLIEGRWEPGKEIGIAIFA